MQKRISATRESSAKRNKNSKNDFLIESNLSKYILSGISAITLGALGSALWEIVLRPFSILFLNCLMNLYSTYFDGVYRYVATGGNYLLTALASLFFSFAMIWIFTRSTSFKNYLVFISKSFFVRMIWFFMLTYIFLSRAYYDGTAKSTLRDIDIVSPYISDQEYNQLRSDFYSMDSKADYVSLRSAIDQIIESEELAE